MATKRGYYREEMERAVSNLEMALTHLVRVGGAYSEAHPEVTEKINEVCEALVTIGEIIQSIHDNI